MDSNMAGNESYVYALIWSELSSPIDITLGLKGFRIDLRGVETAEAGLDGRKGEGSSGLWYFVHGDQLTCFLLRAVESADEVGVFRTSSCESADDS